MKCKVVLLNIYMIGVMLVGFTINVSAEVSFSDVADEIQLPDDVQDVLRSIGFTEFTAEKISNISIIDTFRAIVDIFKGSLKTPLETLCGLIALIIVSSVGNGYMTGNGSMSQFFDTSVTMFIVLFAFSGAAESIDTAIDSMYTGGILMKSLIPIVGTLSVLSGSPSAAVSYNAVSMYCAQAISALCRDFLSPILSVISVVAVCSGVNNIFNFTPVINTVKKFVNVILGLCGTIYTGILALKDVLAVGIDKVAVKGVKFVIGSAVPVVGSALSEGLSSIIASVSLMRNTYGTIGIIVVVAVTLPAVCELVLWIFTFMISSYAAQTLGLDSVAAILENIRYVMSMLLSILLFTVYILIISSAMIILLGGNKA